MAEERNRAFGAGEKFAALGGPALWGEVPRRPTRAGTRRAGTQERADYRNNDRQPRSEQRLPIAKWKIERYDGQPGQLARFLRTLDQFAEAERMTPEELYRGRIHLGSAMDWTAWTANLATWEELVAELTLFVHGTRFDSERLRAIEKLRQEKNESCARFINIMELELLSLNTPLSESEKVELLLKGLRADIGVPLASNLAVQSVREVRSAATRMERILGDIC